MFERVLSTTLGVIGAIVGSVLGFLLFFWIYQQGFYALVIPGASLGLGCGLLSRHHSAARGAACAIAAVALGLFSESAVRPFVVDQRFSYLVLHFYDLKRITLIMIGLGAAMAYFLGRDTGFPGSRGDAVAGTADLRSTRDFRD